MPSYVHIYCGDGKGKTTAAVGLAVRAAGAGKSVLFTQFFKDGSSSEMKVLQNVEQIQTIHCETVRGFWRNMDDQQKMQASNDYTRLFQQVAMMAQTTDLLVLDEIISACNHGAVAERLVMEFLDSRPQHLEVVLTGRNPSENLLMRADYVSELRKVKHPYDRGIIARKGIEF